MLHVLSRGTSCRRTRFFVDVWCDFISSGQSAAFARPSLMWSHYLRGWNMLSTPAPDEGQFSRRIWLFFYRISPWHQQKDFVTQPQPVCQFPVNLMRWFSSFAVYCNTVAQSGEGSHCLTGSPQLFSQGKYPCGIRCHYLLLCTSLRHYQPSCVTQSQPPVNVTHARHPVRSSCA